MAEAISGLPRSASGYILEQAETSNEIIIRPVPEGFRTWLPAFSVLAGAFFIVLMIGKPGMISSLKHSFATAPAYSAARGAEKGTEPVSFVRIPLSEMGPAGVRTGFRDLALVGGSTDFKEKVELNKAKILELASADLVNTTVSDMDRPEGLDAKRAQLLADVNHALGGSVVGDVFLSEWPAKRP